MRGGGRRSARLESFVFASFLFLSKLSMSIIVKVKVMSIFFTEFRKKHLARTKVPKKVCMYEASYDTSFDGYNNYNYQIQASYRPF